MVTSGEGLTRKSRKKISGMLKIPFNLIGMWDTQVYKFGKTH